MEAREGDDHFAERLAALDESLADGTNELGLAGKDDPRLASARETLQRLENAWPRRKSIGVTSVPTGFGRFRLLRILGTGGFGIVYLADDSRLGRQVAVKMPRPESLMTPSLRERFLREARAVAQLQHPHIVPIFDSGEQGSWCFLVSAYCAGGSLAVWLKKQKTLLPCRTAAQLIVVLADAVQHAHEHGILHCDLKPGNILLTQPLDSADAWAGFPFTPHVADFGLAKIVQVATDGEGDPTITGSSAVLGTPAYMAPEQARGDRHSMTAATDVYALGTILYELLTGHAPFRAASNLEVLQQVVNHDPVPPVRIRRDVPRDLEAICLKCLEKNPQQRYHTAKELAADLANFLAARSTQARPLTFWKHGLRWGYRRPNLALGLPFVCLLLVGLLVGGIWNYQAQQVNDADRIAADLREKKLVRRQDYLAAIHRGAALFKEKRNELLWEALNGQFPQDGQEDLRGFEWHYLWSQGRGLTQLSEQAPWLYQVLFSSDGRQCYALGERIFNTWDANTGRLQSALNLDASLLLRGQAMSHNARRLVTTREQVAACEIAIRDGKTARQLATRTYPNREALHFALHPEGHQVLIAGAEQDKYGVIRVWDSDTDQDYVLWRNLARHPTCLRFSDDGKHFAAAITLVDDPDGRWEIHLFDSAMQKRKLAFSGRQQYISALAFSPDGLTLASGAFGGTVTLWHAATGKALHKLNGLSADVLGLAFSPDGKTLAASVHTPTLRLANRVVVWDTATGKLRCEPLVADWNVSDLAFSPDGLSIAIACIDKVRWWRFDEPTRPFDSFYAHEGSETWGIAFAPDRPVLATSGDDNVAKVWDIKTQKEIARCKGHSRSCVMAVAFSSDSSRLATAGYEGTVRLWNPENGRELKSLIGHIGPVRSIAFSPDGKMLVSAGDDKTVKRWNAATGELHSSKARHTNKIRQLVFATDGKTFFSGANDNVINVWQAATGAWVRTIAETSEVWALAHSSREPLLAVATKSGDVRILQSDSGVLHAVLKGHSDGVRSVAFSPDGKALASGGLDRSIRLWHVATGQELLCFKDQPHQVNGVAFSADGRILAAALHDGTVRLWRTVN